MTPIIIPVPMQQIDPATLASMPVWLQLLVAGIVGLEFIAAVALLVLVLIAAWRDR